MRSNRVLHIEVRLLDVEDDQYEAMKEVATSLARDLHATATLLCGGRSRPKVFHHGHNYRVDVGAIVDEPATGET